MPRCRGAWAKRFWERAHNLRLADLTQTTDRATVSMSVTYLRTVAAAVVFIDQAPPATTFLQALQFQIPTAVRFTVSLPQKEQV